MTDLTTFDFYGDNPEGEPIEVRTECDENGVVWFVAKDITDAIGYKKSREAVRDHVDPEDRSTTKIGQKGAGFGGAQSQITVNESGMYALIFGSTLPAAKKFRRWVTDEVLPSVRKTGGYISPTASLEQREELKRQISMDIEILQLAKGAVTDEWYTAQIARILNRGVTEESKMPLGDANLRITCREYLEGKGLSPEQVSDVNAIFGGRVADYWDKKYPQHAGRTPRHKLDKFASYERPDWHLLDEAWDFYYESIFQPMGF